MKKNVWPKKCFIRSEKAIGPARAGRAGKKKIEKFRLYELPARPDRAGTGTGPAPLPEFSVLAGYRNRDRAAKNPGPAPVRHRPGPAHKNDSYVCFERPPPFRPPPCRPEGRSKQELHIRPGIGGGLLNYSILKYRATQYRARPGQASPASSRHRTGLAASLVLGNPG